MQLYNRFSSDKSPSSEGIAPVNMLSERPLFFIWWAINTRTNKHKNTKIHVLSLNKISIKNIQLLEQQMWIFIKNTKKKENCNFTMMSDSINRQALKELHLLTRYCKGPCFYCDDRLIWEKTNIITLNLHLELNKIRIKNIHTTLEKTNMNFHKKHKKEGKLQLYNPVSSDKSPSSEGISSVNLFW